MDAVGFDPLSIRGPALEMVGGRRARAVLACCSRAARAAPSRTSTARRRPERRHDDHDDHDDERAAADHGSTVPQFVFATVAGSRDRCATRIEGHSWRPGCPVAAGAAALRPALVLGLRRRRASGRAGGERRRGRRHRRARSGACSPIASRSAGCSWSTTSAPTTTRRSKPTTPLHSTAARSPAERGGHSMRTAEPSTSTRSRTRISITDTTSHAASNLDSRANVRPGMAVRRRSARRCVRRGRLGMGRTTGPRRSTISTSPATAGEALTHAALRRIAICGRSADGAPLLAGSVVLEPARPVDVPEDVGRSACPAEVLPPSQSSHHPGRQPAEECQGVGRGLDRRVGARRCRVRQDRRRDDRRLVTRDGAPGRGSAVADSGADRALGAPRDDVLGSALRPRVATAPVVTAPTIATGHGSVRRRPARHHRTVRRLRDRRRGDGARG